MKTKKPNKAERAQNTELALDKYFRRWLTQYSDNRDGFMFIRLLCAHLESTGQKITGPVPTPGQRRKRFDALLTEALIAMRNKLNAVYDAYQKGLL